MKINVVTVYAGWILSHIANRVIQAGQGMADWSRTEYEYRLETSKQFDAHFFVDVGNCYAHPTGTYDIGLFTHLDQHSASSFNRAWLSLHHVIHMSRRYYDFFVELGYPEQKMSIVYPFDVSHFPMKKPVIGIFQRGEYPGKGYNFMQEVMRQPVSRHFKFVFVGQGWDGVLDIAGANGITTEWHDDANYGAYSGLYQACDYVLVPSLWEGGPMSIPEAMAHGVPVISADVGWAGLDFPVEHQFPRGDVGALVRIFEEIHGKLVARRNLVAGASYQALATKVVTLAKEQPRYDVLPTGEVVV